MTHQETTAIVVDNPATACFGMYAPAGQLREPAAIDRAIALLRARGHPVIVDAGVPARFQRFAGPDSDRRAAINRVAAHPAIDVALAVRGGYGWTRLLPELDFAALAAARKRWLGHSDFTAFSLAMLAQTGAVTFAGPMAAYDFGAIAPSEFTLAHCFGVLEHAQHAIATKLDGPDGTIDSAMLWGGNLALVTHLVGTPFFPIVEGGILFLEDVGEHPYKVERMLYQLLHAGVLARQRAILLGAFTEYELQENDGGYAMTSVVTQLQACVATPIYTGLPFGHVRDKLTLPVGGRMRLTVRDGQGTMLLTDYAR